jgi:hypothetical protein
MKSATGLALVAIGAILAFAVTAHPSFFNFEVAGWVLMLTGIAGLVIPRRGYGWLRRRLVLRDGARRPAAAGDGPPERRFSRLLMPGGLAGTRSRLSAADVPPTATVQQETIEEFVEE